MKPPEKIDLSIVSPPSVIQLSNDLLKTVESNSLGRKESSESTAAEVSELSKALIAVANQAWRIVNATIDSDSKEIKGELSVQEIKKVGNAVESIKETLGGLGIKIVDRLGQSFNAGLPEQVVTEEHQEGISKEQIIRTIRPTIMWQQTMVQRGEIDIAIPIARKSEQ